MRSTEPSDNSPEGSPGARLAWEILLQTRAYQAGQMGREDLPTSQSLAKTLGMPHEVVKKKLKPLVQSGLIQAVSYNPKRYQLDFYTLESLDLVEGDDLHGLLALSNSTHW